MGLQHARAGCTRDSALVFGGRSVAALASKALGLVPHCPAGAQERGEQQSAGRSRPACASPKGPPPRVPRAGPRPGETRGPEPAAGRAAPSASRPALPPGPPKERAPPAAPRRAVPGRKREHARAVRPGGRGDAGSAADPGAGTARFPLHLGLCSSQQIGPFALKEIITLRGGEGRP